MKAGQKVVCIVDASSWQMVVFSGEFHGVFPAKDQIYTVREVVINDSDFLSGVGISLEGFPVDDFYDSGGFRLVDESFGEEVIEKLECELNLQPA